MSQQSDSMVHRILSSSWVYFMQMIWSLLLVVELNQNSSKNKPYFSAKNMSEQCTESTVLLHAKA